jgi:Domain of unknown function (DUF4126)
MSELDLGLSIALGIGLAAATGLRLFLPMLVVSAASYGGYLPLSDNFAWLATPAALILLGVAALVEILAYYIPGLDNLLDTLATPAAFVAGTIVSAAVITDLPPMVKWAAAIIAGGGIAGLTQSVTTVVRAHSTMMTGTLGNPAVATAELGGSLIVSLLALVAPLLTALVIVVMACLKVGASGCAPPTQQELRRRPARQLDQDARRPPRVQRPLHRRTVS